MHGTMKDTSTQHLTGRMNREEESLSRAAGKGLENTLSSLRLVEPSRAVSFLLDFP